MAAATDLANHFFRDQSLLVYLIGRKYPRRDYKSAGSGDLSSARVVVLTDEGSASASEIFAGAIQDWDRGVIIGRRTFGKGLVQNPFYLTDGSMIRLTIARYCFNSMIFAPVSDEAEPHHLETFSRLSFTASTT